MSYCFNPDCQQPENESGTKVCQSCGINLLLAGRYRAVKLIGQGGFGRTLLTEDEFRPLKPLCAIKQFYPQGQNNSHKARELFDAEAERLYQLGKHPQIPQLLTHFESANLICDSPECGLSLSLDRYPLENPKDCPLWRYIVQEFIDGQNLAQELAETGAFGESQIKSLLFDLLPVLQFIHVQGVIHRDIKPENIIRRSSDDKLVLVDFGAAKFVTETASGKTGTTIGSAGYAAPEQSFGKAAFASDIYSLGVTCIHLLTQMEPFDLYDASEVAFLWRQYLVDNPVSDELAHILDKMIQSSVKQRYRSAQEVLQDLNSAPVIPGKSVLLASEVDADYTKLRDLLAAKLWKEADEETLRMMLWVARREKKGWLRDRDILQFPCTDLRTIDQLWLHYSGGRFGFSVQKRIYEKVGNHHQLAERVGWKEGEKWLRDSEFTFELRAPVGHLPAVSSWVRDLWRWVGKSAIVVGAAVDPISALLFGVRRQGYRGLGLVAWRVGILCSALAQRRGSCDIVGSDLK